MIYYAKSKPDILTIFEHTNDVLDAVKVLCQNYGKHLSFLTKEDWNLIELSAKYHDLGKYSDGFQDVIQNAIDPNYRKKGLRNYPHNYLSVGLLPFKELKKLFSLEQLICLVFAVGFHHERDEYPSKEVLLTLFDQQIKHNISVIKEISVADHPSPAAINILIKREQMLKDIKSDLFKKYILIKGLLQRADHAASAKRKFEDVNEYVEQAVEANVGENTKSYLESAYGGLRPLQKMTFKHQDKNILLVAQTGSGKTEAALLWIGERKGFITLPLRVSLNAMYDRIINEQEINFLNVGLLHSSAIDYFFDKNADTDETAYEQSILQVEHTKRLAKKITLSTIDQLFKFPLLYRGFEVELSTLAYSKVVIDEIQAYDPHIVAILLKGLKMIDELGGQWMIMTATLPTIFKEGLKKLGLLGENTIEETLLIPDDRQEKMEIPRRHRIQLMPCSIVECVEEILKRSENAKVLVVVNTVKQALTLYDELKNCTNCYLLHSQFIAKHRQIKETKILEFATLENEDVGIWITTQIVEASLDVDFDFLFTEAATPDALFQRFGRCNRKGKRYEGGVPTEINVFICSDAANSSGVGIKNAIYELPIVENGLRELSGFDGELLGEQEKILIVEHVFSREQLEGTTYLSLFDQAMDELERIQPFTKNKKEAQGILRKIQSCSFVPGLENYEVVLSLIEEYQQIDPKLSNQERKKIRQQIMLEIQSYIVSVNYNSLIYKMKKGQYTLSHFSQKGFEYIYYSTDVKYSEKRGLELTVDEDFDPIF